MRPDKTPNMAKQKKTRKKKKRGQRAKPNAELNATLGNPTLLSIKKDILDADSHLS